MGSIANTIRELTQRMINPAPFHSRRGKEQIIAERWFCERTVFSDSEASANLFPSAWRVANCVGARAYGIGFDLIAWLLGWSVETMDRERALLYSNFKAK